MERYQLFNRKKAARRFLKGESTTSIGASFGVSREAVRQALAGMGIYGVDGGRALRAKRLAAERSKAAGAAEKMRARRLLPVFGLSLDDYDRIRATPEGAALLKAYATQRKAKISEGVKWRLTFKQWRAVWSRSGVWDRRARGAFGLARLRSDLPFQPGNVAIVWQPFRFRGRPIPRRACAYAGRCADAR